MGDSTSGVSRETPDDFEVIEPSKRREVTVCGETLVVTPLEVRQLPGFARAVRPLLDSLADLLQEDGFDATKMSVFIEEHLDGLVEACAIASDTEHSDLAKAQLDEFTELVVAVFAVNTDFFVRRLLPSLAENANALAGTLRAASGGGRTQSTH